MGRLYLRARCVLLITQVVFGGKGLSSWFQPTAYMFVQLPGQATPGKLSGSSALGLLLII